VAGAAVAAPATAGRPPEYQIWADAVCEESAASTTIAREIGFIGGFLEDTFGVDLIARKSFASG
jgi:hypothetical protein